MKNSLRKAVFLFKTKILNPKLERLNQRTQKVLKNTDLANFNFSRRQALVKHALNNSTFYQEKYKNLELTAGIKTNDDFLKLPLLTRDELRDNFEAIKAIKVTKLNGEKVSTSGSTGNPVALIHDKRHPETPIRWRILRWWGVQPWENQAFIYRYKRSFWQRLGNRLLWWPTKRIFLAAANPTKEQLQTFVLDFNRIQPTLVQGYVDVVFEFALYLLDNNIKIHPPKMVWVTSAPLFEEQRELMQKAFGAPVCDQYGNTEIMLIAAECKRQQGLHIMQDTVHIEFVDQNNLPVPPNTNGRILLTDLTNYAFPIIRYDIGDEGGYLSEPCSCGNPLPLMKNVRGRQAHNIQTPSGLRIKGDHLMVMFSGFMKHFKEIQLRQEQDFTVYLDYVPRKENLAAREAQEMAAMLMSRSRAEIKVVCKEVKKIKQVGTKTPLIINNLKNK